MTPVNVGTRRELFVDGLLIDSMRGAHLQLAHPERREVAFEADAPWEDSAFFPCSVIEQDERILLYYRAAIPDMKDENISVMALAESRDGGRSFIRPSLGLCEFKGGKDNNILWQGRTPGIPPGFIDGNPACAPEARYKGLDIEVTSEHSWLFAMCSADGIGWRRMQDEHVDMPGAFDTINTAFWDAQADCYRCYTRFYNPAARSNGKDARAIQTSTSSDFIHWTPPVPLEYEDGDASMQLYTNGIQPCPGAEHIYVGFPNRYVEERNKAADAPAETRGVGFWGMNDALFMASRDGLHWCRYGEAWVRPGLDPGNWTHRNNYPAWHIIGASREEWSMLITEHYMQQDGSPGRLRRLSIRPWGFVSVHAGFDAGEMLTKPLVFGGRALHLNYSTSAAGSVQVEVQDNDGRAIAGFGMDDMELLFGDELDAAVRWRGGGDLGPLAGKPLRLRFVLKDADLFALRFGDLA